jgi:hypothetical protein
MLMDIDRMRRWAQEAAHAVIEGSTEVYAGPYAEDVPTLLAEIGRLRDCLREKDEIIKAYAAPEDVACLRPSPLEQALDAVEARITEDRCMPHHGAADAEWSPR